MGGTPPVAVRIERSLRKSFVPSASKRTDAVASSAASDGEPNLGLLEVPALSYNPEQHSIREAFPIANASTDMRCV